MRLFLADARRTSHGVKIKDGDMHTALKEVLTWGHIKHAEIFGEELAIKV